MTKNYIQGSSQANGKQRVGQPTYDFLLVLMEDQSIG